MKKKSRPLTSRENWFLSLVNLPLWRIVFINTRWRDWSRRTPAPLLTKIRMETNTKRKLTSCMSWKLILLWGFSAIDLPVTKRKKRELIVSVIWRNLLNEERWSRRLELFRRWFLVISCYSCARSVCSCAVFFKNLLLILRQSIENFDITGFLNQMIFLKKKIRGKNVRSMFKIETYNIFIVKKIDLFNLHVSSGTNLYFDIGCPSEQKKIEYACYIWRKKN